MQRWKWIFKILTRLDPRFVNWLERQLKRIPKFQAQVEEEYQELMAGFENSLKPYEQEFPGYRTLPVMGLDKHEILKRMQAINDREEDVWRQGYASGAVYHGDQEHINFLNQVYALHSQANPLHADIWPSVSKYEAEIVAMTANMLGGSPIPSNNSGQICGTVTSGGTESILLAMKAYRDRARELYGIRNPEMLLPITAHAAFDKAAQYFDLKPVRIPIDSEYKADVKAARAAITGNTVVIVGSAPSFPHGIVDPIDELSELARQNGIGFHTDACLGGFILPWAERLGYTVPAFDFRLPGVTSISADTHKYGYAAKGTSVILYRGLELRRYQYFTVADWPGGLYISPTFAGSRPGALSAACWAAMVATGEQGYLDSARKILAVAEQIKTAIDSIPELFVLGNPLFVIAFGAYELDIYRIQESMSRKGWSLNGLHRPSCIHICVTLRHTQEGVADRFITDLKSSISEVRTEQVDSSGMAPVYGMAATLPLRGLVDEMLVRYLDLLYKV